MADPIQRSRSRIKRGGALPMKCSKYFGAKWRGFIKSESILAPKGASRFKTQNFRHDTKLRTNKNNCIH